MRESLATEAKEHTLDMSESVLSSRMLEVLALRFRVIAPRARAIFGKRSRDFKWCLGTISTCSPWFSDVKRIANNLAHLLPLTATRSLVRIWSDGSLSDANSFKTHSRRFPLRA